MGVVGLPRGFFMTDLAYRSDLEEKAFGIALSGIVSEFGRANVRLRFPQAFAEHKEAFSFDGLIAEFTTEDTIEIVVPGTDIRHITKLVKVA